MMSESLVVTSDVHQTVTEVLGQLVLDDFKQTDITVKLLQEQVELNLGYSEGSLNKWHNALSTAIREFFRGVQSKKPPSLQTALTWASQVPQPAAQRDEVPSVDLQETMPVQQDLIDAVPPFIPPPKWMVMAHPASRDALQAFQWTGKRLDTKFEGGWITASHTETGM